MLFFYEKMGSILILAALAADADKNGDQQQNRNSNHHAHAHLETILNVPRVFLPLVLKGCVEWARENNVELIDASHMKIINDKRAKEKNKK